MKVFCEMVWHAQFRMLLSSLYIYVFIQYATDSQINEAVSLPCNFVIS